MQPSAKLKNHVSHHLEELALFSLSKVNEMAGSEMADSHLSKQKANGSVDQNHHPQDGSRGGQSTAQSDQSQPTFTQATHPERSDIDNPIDQAIVPDSADTQVLRS